MDFELVSELWNYVKSGMPKVDREAAADFIVNMFIENGLGMDELKEAFGSDSDIKTAIADYFGDDSDSDWESDGGDEEDYDEDYDDSDDDY